MKRARKLAPDTDIVALLKSLTPDGRRRAIDLLSEAERDALDRAWESWAHDGQLAPPKASDGSEWSNWVIMAGRGFGKTLAGAQWITARLAARIAAHAAAPASGQGALRIALVGATLDDARRVMVEGNSGLLTVAAPWIDDWQPSLRRLRFRSGAQATLFSGATPDLLRGPEHHYAWCDELAKWANPQETWDTLQMGLRLGANPQAIVTTTPRPGPVLRAIMDAPGTVVTGGPTRANPHLPRAWKERVERHYAGTRLGRQELDGELLADAAGALWTVELIERCRFISPSPSGEGTGVGSVRRGRRRIQSTNPTPTPPLKGRGDFTRTLIAVDPPSCDGTCGIIACAREGPGSSGGTRS